MTVSAVYCEQMYPVMTELRDKCASNSELAELIIDRLPSINSIFLDYDDQQFGSVEEEKLETFAELYEIVHFFDGVPESNPLYSTIEGIKTVVRQALNMKYNLNILNNQKLMSFLKSHYIIRRCKNFETLKELVVIQRDLMPGMTLANVPNPTSLTSLKANIAAKVDRTERWDAEFNKDYEEVQLYIKDAEYYLAKLFKKHPFLNDKKYHNALFLCALMSSIKFRADRVVVMTDVVEKFIPRSFYISYGLNSFDLYQLLRNMEPVFLELMGYNLSTEDVRLYEDVV